MFAAADGKSKATSMRKKLVILAAFLVATAALGGVGVAVWHGSTASGPAPAPAPPSVPVIAAKVVASDVPIYLRGVGTVIAYNNVVVRSQITGQITKINFRQGQTVHKGDLLAQIDPRPYQAQLDQATANRDRDQAQLANAQANLGRYTPLLAKGFATQQLVDTQKAQVAQLEAMIKSDEAVIESAQVNLAYTRLTAPIDGVTGIRQIAKPRSPKSSRRWPRDRSRSWPIARMTRPSSTKASSCSSTTRSFRQPARSGCALLFRMRSVRCGRVSWSTCGCFSALSRTD